MMLESDKISKKVISYLPASLSGFRALVLDVDERV